MPKQNGVVLVFEAGVSKEEIEKRLKEAVGDILDPNYAQPTIQVEEFDSQYGGPVWYVP